MEYSTSLLNKEDDIDQNKIVLWGTSAGANYEIIIASENKEIAVVIDQCGSFDHKEDEYMWFYVMIMYFIIAPFYSQGSNTLSTFYYTSSPIQEYLNPDNHK